MLISALCATRKPVRHIPISECRYSPEEVERSQDEGPQLQPAQPHVWVQVWLSWCTAGAGSWSKAQQFQVGDKKSREVTGMEYLIRLSTHKVWSTSLNFGGREHQGFSLSHAAGYSRLRKGSRNGWPVGELREALSSRSSMH